MDDELKYTIAKNNLSSKLGISTKYNFNDEELYKRDGFASNFIPERMKTVNSSIVALK